MVHHHFLLVPYPAQSHINPALQFAKRLIQLGQKVTFAITVSVHRRMSKAPTLKGLTFATFSNGYDDGLKATDDAKHFISELRSHGSQFLTELIVASANEGRPFSCLIYTLFLTWPPVVARSLHIPSALLWIQPATVLDIYHYYFNGYSDYITNNINDPSCSIELPGLPLLTGRDLPSFLVPSASDTNTLFISTFQEQLEALNEETNSKVLVNTFDALEPKALRAIDKLNMIPIGPLIPSAFLDGKDPSDTSFGGDLFKCWGDYMEWLNLKAQSTVIYLSFGSFSVLSKRQMEEIARGLLESRQPFLWVIRAPENGEEEKEEDKLSCIEELEQVGMIVPWCSQIEVLSHPSLGCFVTHCGWNSSLESLVSGVPVVAFPQWLDQGTNAKLIEDVWKTGVRVTVNAEGIVECDEIKRCLEMVMGSGERGEEMRRNANKWKDLAKEAQKENGSSYKNLKAFVDEVGEG